MQLRPLSSLAALPSLALVVAALSGPGCVQTDDARRAEADSVADRAARPSNEAPSTDSAAAATEAAPVPATIADRLPDWVRVPSGPPLRLAALDSSAAPSPTSDERGTDRTLDVALQSGHPGDAYTVKFTPDGHYLATGGGERSDAAVRLWNVSTRKELRVLPQPYAVESLEISPDGAHLRAIGGIFELETGRRVHGADSTEAFWDGRVEPWYPSPDWKVVVALEWDHGSERGGLRVMRFGSDEVLTRFDLGGARASKVVFARDAPRFAASVELPGDEGRAILVFDWSSERQVANLPGQSPRLALLSPDGTHLLVASEKKQLGLFDLARPDAYRWELDAIPAANIGLPNGTGFVGDGDSLLVGDIGGNALLLLDAATGSIRRRFVAPDPLLGLALDSERGVLAGSFGEKWGGKSKSGQPHGIRLWNFATGETLKDLRDDARQAYAWLDFAPDGRSLASAGFNLSPALWDVAEGRRTWRLEGQVVEPDTVAFHPGDRYLAILGSDSRLRVTDLATARVEATIDNCWYIDWDPRGRWLGIVPAREGNKSQAVVLLWNPERGAIERVLEAPGVQPTAFGFDTTGSRLAAVGWYAGRVVVWDTARSEPLWQGQAMNPSHAAFSPDGKRLAVAMMSSDGAGVSVRIFDARSGERITDLPGDDARQVAFSPDGRWLAVADNLNSLPHVLLFDTSTWKQVADHGGHDWIVSDLAFTADSSRIVSADMSGKVVVRDRASGTLVKRFSAHGFKINGIDLSPAGDTLASCSKDGRTILWDTRDFSPLATVIVGHEEEAVFLTPEGHYTMSPRARQLVAFADGLRAYPFEQFDLPLNRPDLVVRRLGRTSSAIAELFERAWAKRVRRMGFEDGRLGDRGELPELEIVGRDALPISQPGRELRLHVRAGGVTPPKRLNLFVNDVAVFGSAGRDISGDGRATWDGTVAVELGTGRNKVQLSCHDEAGLESLRSTFEIDCTAKEVRPDAYVLAIGVSAYAQSEYDLVYAAKDARDIAAAFEANGLYGKVHTRVLTDGGATRDSILAARAFLEEARVDDQVILFVAGHGVLSEELDYYFGTHDIDFAQPATRGLSYGDLEGLVDGIRARKKLVLMDTCHSGELETESTELVAAATAPGVKQRSTRGLRVARSTAAEDLTDLLEQLFTDLRRGTGAVVVTSSSGTEFSYEDDRWSNGIFSFAVLEGLRERRAATADGPIRASELMEYVGRRVTELTGGLQTPTMRRDNLEQDFAIWR